MEKNKNKKKKEEQWKYRKGNKEHAVQALC